MGNKLTNKKRSIVYSGIIFVAFAAYLTALFWRMAVKYEGPKGYYLSDISEHIRYFLAGDGAGYSLINDIELLLYRVFPHGNLAVAVFISIMTTLTPFFTYLFMKRLAPDCNSKLLLLLSFICLFSIPLYVPYINGMMYAGGFSGANWHNDTYIGMRLLAIILLFFFCEWSERYLRNFGIKEIIVSTILFSVINWAKPNFIIAFAPAMLIMMIVDIVRSKGIGFKNWILFGVPVLISCLVLLYQAKSLFGVEQIDGTGHEGVIISFGTNLKSYDHPVIMIFQSMAFPLIVFVLNRREVIRSKISLVSILTYVFAFIEFLFLGESGYRAEHGNFGWGLSLASYLLFCISCVFFAGNIHSFIVSKPKGKNIREYANADPKHFLKLFGTGFILVLHLLCGIMYFVIVSLGACAYMF